jgi:hypothetical protein
MIEFHRIWVEQCEAAQGIREAFGLEKAIGYLIGEKLLNFLGEADRARDRGNTAAAGRSGFRVLSLWEHEFKKNAGACVARIVRAARRSSSSAAPRVPPP